MSMMRRMDTRPSPEMMAHTNNNPMFASYWDMTYGGHLNLKPRWERWHYEWVQNYPELRDILDEAAKNRMPAWQADKVYWQFYRQHIQAQKELAWDKLNKAYTPKKFVYRPNLQEKWWIEHLDKFERANPQYSAKRQRK